MQVTDSVMTSNFTLMVNLARFGLGNRGGKSMNPWFKCKRNYLCAFAFLNLTRARSLHNMLDLWELWFGDPTGIRTPAATVKGWCPNH
jgi:hypothetical protein